MRALVIGEGAVNVARAVLILAFAKLFYDETGGIWAFALAFIGENVITFLLPIFLGNALDGRGADRVLRGSAAGAVLVSLIGMAMIIPLGTTTTLLLMLSIALSGLSAAMRMAVFVVTPDIAPEGGLERANGRLVFAMQAGQLIGMGLAAILLIYTTPVLILAVVAAFFSAGMIGYHLALGSRRTSGAEPAKETAAVRLRETLRLSKRFLPALVISNFDLVAVAMFNVLLAAVVAMRYGNNPAWLSGLDALFAVGALLGGVFVANSWRPHRTSLVDVVLAQAAFLLCLTAWYFEAGRWPALAAVAVFGVMLTPAGVFWRTYLQSRFPAAARGRLTGARTFTASLQITAVSAFLSVAHAQGFETALGAAALITVLHITGIVFFGREEMRPSEEEQAYGFTGRKLAVPVASATAEARRADHG